MEISNFKKNKPGNVEISHSEQNNLCNEIVTEVIETIINKIAHVQNSQRGTIILNLANFIGTTLFANVLNNNDCDYQGLKNCFITELSELLDESFEMLSKRKNNDIN